MKKHPTMLWLALGLGALAGSALAQTRPAAVDPGQREFDANCASCHGTSGRGDGALVPAHGSRDMPVWGRDYRVKDAEYFMESPCNAEAHVRARILGLLEHINRIQAK